jgi:hypothetical protein
MQISSIIQSTCPVCGSGVASRFLTGGKFPLATLAWPRSTAEAQALPKLRHDFVQCTHCGHIWNYSFDDSEIPYQINPMRMFNAGKSWQMHLVAITHLLRDRLQKDSTIIEIGAGDCDFIQRLAHDNHFNGKYFAFDICAVESKLDRVQFYPRYFDPISDTLNLEPDLLIMRHVIEHMLHPAKFVESLSWSSKKLNKPIHLFVEVPCVDKTIRFGRLVDFFYEHYSHFTTNSFISLLQKYGRFELISHAYDEEVIFALLELQVSNETYAARSEEFNKRSRITISSVQELLYSLVSEGKRVVIWGGTGKGAAFLNKYNLDSDRFPVVVDSDTTKKGFFVPGTGQMIKHRDELKGLWIDVIVITSAWRAKDIMSEISAEQITVSTVLIESNGRLIEVYSDRKMHL